MGTLLCLMTGGTGQSGTFIYRIFFFGVNESFCGAEESIGESCCCESCPELCCCKSFCCKSCCDSCCGEPGNRFIDMESCTEDELAMFIASLSRTVMHAFTVNDRIN